MHVLNEQHGANRQAGLARGLGRVLLGTGAILLVPLVAMRFDSGVNWTAFDFLVAAILLAGVGSCHVLLGRRLRAVFQRRVAGGVLLLVLALVWAELAVGLFGSPIAGS